MDFRLGTTMIESRLSTHDWAAIAAELDARGFALVQGMLSTAECTRQPLSLFRRR